MGRPDYISGQFRETARCRDAQHGDGVCWEWTWKFETVDGWLIWSQNVCSKFNYDRLCTDKDLGDFQKSVLITTTTTIRTPVALRVSKIWCCAIILERRRKSGIAGDDYVAVFRLRPWRQQVRAMLTYQRTALTAHHGVTSDRPYVH